MKTSLSHTLFTVLMLLAASAWADDVHLTIMQTADIHSHFTNRESPVALGGVARLKTKIDEIRAGYKNTMLLDAGDWSEGSIFFTLNSGEASQRMLKHFGYDAIVLGNHDWLVGAKELYQSLNAAEMNIPIVSANLKMNGLPADIPLKDYIKPYVVKEFDGVRVGILGLSTFELIYDSYFKPVKLTNPLTTARHYIKVLRGREKCQVVIVLSHMGIMTDKILAAIPGIDLIIGGHTHVLLTKPAYIGNTPITHVGKHGEYLGQLDLVIHNGKAKLEKYQVHRMDSTVSEDPVTVAMVDGYTQELEAQFGQIFKDHVAYTDVDLPIQNNHGESAVRNILIDSMRDIGKGDVAFDNPMFTSRDFYRGYLDSVDFFNAFSHIWDRQTLKTWTVKSFEILGVHLRGIVSGFVRFNMALSVSNAKVIVDKTKKIDQVDQFTIGGEPIRLFDTYKVVGTDGIVAAVQFLKDNHFPISIDEVTDTGVEPWRLAVQKLRELSPITREKVPWEGRFRTIQPDLMIRGEDFMVYHDDSTSKIYTLEAVVRNAGFNTAKPGKVTVSYDPMPWDQEENEALLPVDPQISFAVVPPLAGGEAQKFIFNWDTTGLQPGRYRVVTSVQGDVEQGNNQFETFVDLN